MTGRGVRVIAIGIVGSLVFAGLALAASTTYSGALPAQAPGYPRAVLSFDRTSDGKITHVAMKGGLAGCYGSDFGGGINKRDFPSPEGRVTGNKFFAQATRKIRQKYVHGLRTTLAGHFTKQAAVGTIQFTWLQSKPFKNCTIKSSFTLKRK